MTAKLDYRWHLREIMATRGMFSTTGLRPLLAERGIDLSPSQVYRLVVDRPERLSLRTLVALMDILDCRMEELITPVAARASRTRKTAASGGDGAEDGGGEAGVGEFRPKRARITPTS
ncbi:helix-turn-helix transcriptional regulator [Actinosynnema sp. NPDC023794]